ncbi:MAG: 16S rRNA (cytidine(1402)-2'-O)-methyltransferase [Mycoplasma sp.]|nr:16S rRNA (cytidine(1402)-2'-O)-methyltransferase [Mycoplasma sp.]
MDKKIFIVGTPIGNFNDITLRALETLKMVDIIACEDTRVTIKLLNHFDIKDKKLISYHNFNEKQSAKGIIDLVINKEKNVALVSDAGMPSISDPGFELIELAKKHSVTLEIIPGVSALTTAITASGLGPNFTFLGFGKNKKNQLENQIKELLPGTYILFSAPHKVQYLLEIIDKNVKEHIVFLAREMTKKYETFYCGTANEVLNQIKSNLKGEITVVLKILESKKIKLNKYK